MWHKSRHTPSTDTRTSGLAELDVHLSEPLHAQKKSDMDKDGFFMFVTACLDNNDSESDGRLLTASSIVPRMAVGAE